VQVDAEGLVALAARCEQHGASLGLVNAPAAGGGGFEPSAAAVRAAHAEVSATGARLSARMVSTAAALAGAAHGYAATDDDNASDIAAVTAQGVTAV
jgi:hypothetical protein